MCELMQFSTDWDLGVCLQYECRRKQIRKPVYFDQWIDLRIVYKQFYDRKPSGLCGSLEDLGIPFTGREHCGKPATYILIAKISGGFRRWNKGGSFL